MHPFLPELPIYSPHTAGPEAPTIAIRKAKPAAPTFSGALSLILALNLALPGQVLAQAKNQAQSQSQVKAQSQAQPKTQTYVLDGKAITEDQYKAAELVQLSLKAFRAGDLQTALSKAEEADKIAPNFYYVLGALGIAQARLGRNDEAVANLTRAHEMKPDSPDFLWSLGATLQSAGRTEEALTRLDEFLKRFPNDPKAEQGKGLRTLLLRQKQAMDKVSEHSEQDYYAEAVSQKVMRWADDAMPVKVFIEDSSKVPGYKPEFADAFRQALDEWQSATAGKVRFEITDKKDLARAEVVWTNKQSDVSNPAEGGETRLVPHGQVLSAAKIILLTTPPTNGLIMNRALMHFVCLHELGHTLGIAGHSNRPGDVMFTSLPLNFDNVKVSQRDAATMTRLYDVPLAARSGTSGGNGGGSGSGEAGTSGDTNAGDGSNTNTRPVHVNSLSEIDNALAIAAMNDKAVAAMNKADYAAAAAILKEACAKFPESDVLKRNYAAALNNVGLDAMKTQQFTRAIAIFKQSLALDADSKTALGNLGVAHYNFGLSLLKAGKPTEALSDLRQARDILQKTGNKELLTSVSGLIESAEKQTKSESKINPGSN